MSLPTCEWQVGYQSSASDFWQKVCSLRCVEDEISFLDLGWFGFNLTGSMHIWVVEWENLSAQAHSMELVVYSPPDDVAWTWAELIVLWGWFVTFVLTPVGGLWIFLNSYQARQAKEELSEAPISNLRDQETQTMPGAQETNAVLASSTPAPVTPPQAFQERGVGRNSSRPLGIDLTPRRAAGTRTYLEDMVSRADHTSPWKWEARAGPIIWERRWSVP